MSAHDRGSADEGPEQYCRAVETYLCRKNDGHLIRIVGPAFEQVCGWATRGVPFRIACLGIDRYFERYYAKGPRRRPVRIEFCEADVLDAFDEWRRAVGVPSTALGAGPSTAPGTNAAEGKAEFGRRHHEPLSLHLERVSARLSGLRANADPELSGRYDALVRELDAARGTSKGLRGHAREVLLERLRELDALLLASVRERCEVTTLRELEALADEELRPFRPRMTGDVYAGAQRACVDRLVRERFRLPVLAFE